MDDVTKEELAQSLLWMVQQYLQSNDKSLRAYDMIAGETALDLLERLGKVTTMDNTHYYLLEE